MLVEQALVREAVHMYHLTVDLKLVLSLLKLTPDQELVFKVLLTIGQVRKKMKANSRRPKILKVLKDVHNKQ
jgi:hypothetical protein